MDKKKKEMIKRGYSDDGDWGREIVIIARFSDLNIYTHFKLHNCGLIKVDVHSFSHIKHLHDFSCKLYQDMQKIVLPVWFLKVWHYNCKEVHFKPLLEELKKQKNYRKGLIN